MYSLLKNRVELPQKLYIIKLNFEYIIIFCHSHRMIFANHKILSCRPHLALGP